MSGMTAHKGGRAGRATDGSREGGLTPRAHLIWLRVRALPRVSLPLQSLEKNIAEEGGGVAVVGRQGKVDDRENRFSVRGHRGRIIAHGS